MVGKVVNGNHEQPFAIAVVHDDEQRLALDAVLLDSASIDILFSLSRAYFMADMEVPSGYVEFLRTIMPTKPRSEIYSSLGLGKQGKTLFIRDLLHHLHHSEDPFIEAPGFRGQVMHVFTLPSYPYVFKLIRDRFGADEEHDARRGDAEVPDREGGRPCRADGRRARVRRPRAAARPLLAGAAGTARGADAFVGRGRGRQPDRQALLRRAPDDPARHVPPQRRRPRGRPRRRASTATRCASSRSRTSSPATCSGGTSASPDTGALSVTTTTSSSTSPTASSAGSRRRPTPRDELSAEVWYGVGPNDVFPEEFEAFLLGDPALASRVPPPPPGPPRRRRSGRSASGASAPARWSTSSRTRTRSASANRFGDGVGEPAAAAR